MPELPREVEIMRVMNLVQGFGWSKIKEEIIGNKIVLSIEKVLLTEEEVTGGGAPA